MAAARMSCFFFALILLVFQSVKACKSSLCGKKPRPPPGACCPAEEEHLCCPFAGDNETISLCDPHKNRRSLSQPPQKLPTFNPRTACVHTWQTQACAGGFYLDPNSNRPKPCLKGFYCPQKSLCIIPCPSGAYCVPTTKTLEKDKSCGGFGVCCGSDPPLVFNNIARKCNGVDDDTCLCAGPDKPKPCPGGYFCPKPKQKYPCSEGHYCRAGSTSPDPCPFLTRCRKKSSAPITNFIAPLIDFLVLLLFVVLLVLYNKWTTVKFYYNFYFTRVTGRERTSTSTFAVDAGIGNITNRLDQFVSVNEPIEAKSFTIDISFKNLGLTLNSGENKGKVVLQGVTGQVRSGEVTAVMGPSGAGKTTFLNTLSGKAYYGDSTGEILFNGEEVGGIKEFRPITGFVPQDDTMHRNLTVYEVLYYQAVLRLPAGIDSSRLKYKIRQILSILEISHVADSLIGDEETRGISGGQRKRVNIGMELVADPTLLFLDEPTSGLDSTSSLSVLKSLRTVAEQGRLTVLCVIHQPRFEIFNMFHNVLLLGPGGKTVYQGSVTDAKLYFSSLGYETPADVNPADFYMDVIGGAVKPKEGDEEVDLFDSWIAHYSERTNGDSEGARTSSSTVDCTRVMPNPIYQFLTFVRREFLLQIRSVKTLLIDTFLVFLAGGVLGALYLEVKLEKFTGLTRMSGMAIGLTAVLASLRCFGNHRTTFWRESAAGVNRVSYFLAVNFSQLPVIIIMPLVYLSLLYTLTSPRSYFNSNYTVVFAVQLCCSGMGYAISTIFNPKSSQMASVVIILIMAMLSGFSPSLCKLDDLNFFGPVCYSLSYNRWYVEALFEKEALRYPDVDRPIRDTIAFPDHYTLDNYSFCVGIIILMAVVYRIIALVFLLFTNRGKQK